MNLNTFFCLLVLFPLPLSNRIPFQASTKEKRVLRNSVGRALAGFDSFEIAFSGRHCLFHCIIAKPIANIAIQQVPLHATNSKQCATKVKAKAYQYANANANMGILQCQCQCQCEMRMRMNANANASQSNTATSQVRSWSHFITANGINIDFASVIFQLFIEMNEQMKGNIQKNQKYLKNSTRSNGPGLNVNNITLNQQ